ncbi:sulfatase [Arenibacter algicola]|uniref:sulfatase family protein n=1 Tax=Arenibacter algicola TaxID=616991 RepID=UPI001C075149|nr:sulfatase [Arenibacter algicola]MBU2904072.1 sulfatase [Arenibacter algicola]
MRKDESINITKPNIILFITDDQSIESIGCYGNDVIKTPNIDALAAEGVMFTNNFSNSSSCSPNRSVILTGLQNHTNGMYGLNPKPHNFSTFDDVIAFPTYLKKSGYKTGLFGKYHVGPKDVYQFDELNEEKGRNHQELTKNVRQFIEKSDDPFLVFYNTADPHVGGGKVKNSLYMPDRFGNRDEGYPGIETIKYSKDEVIVPSYLPDVPETRAELVEYYQSVSRLDQGLGMLVKMLKETGQYGNTIIFFLSDNGHAMPGAKATLYDSGIHLPLIVRSPFLKKKGIKNNAMVSFVDLAPTIMEMAGLNVDTLNLHGKSFNKILEIENPSGWNEVYGSQTFHLETWYYPRRMIRTDKYKLIRNITFQLDDPAARQYHSTWLGAIKDGGIMYGKRKMEDIVYHNEYELYDLINEPDEINNIYENPNYKQIFDSLVIKLNRFQESTRDPWELKNLRKP